MRFKEITEDGRIVKGVNTTADVGVNQIPIEAAKLGSKVSIDGRPPFLKTNGLVSENFADGKVKGKSKPGRVKKSGASCKGSVTDLRKRAKGASGEKRKMYHWCANMKGGKKSK
jgi:hypothetical protein